MNWRIVLIGILVAAFAACSGGSSETKDVLDTVGDGSSDSSDTITDLATDEMEEIIPDIKPDETVDLEIVDVVEDTDTLDIPKDEKPLDTKMCPADCDDGNDCTYDHCVEGTGCIHDPIPNCCPGQMAFQDNFDGADPFAGYEVAVAVPPYSDDPGLDSVSWDVTTEKSHSPGGSLYFGDSERMNYDNGHRVAASVTTPAFALDADRIYTLAFWVFLGVEEGVYSDYLTVYVVLDGVSYPVWSKSNDAVDKWIQIYVDLSPYAGNEIQLKFYFDSNNEKENSTEGIFIDDIAVTLDCDAVNECTSIAQCDDGNPCTGEACTGGVCTWTLNDECCMDISQCEDWDYCTIEKCVSNECAWQQDPSPNCCNDSDQCDDGDDVCTNDICKNGACAFLPSGAAGCCVSNAECDDQDNCTTDQCINNTCVYTNMCCDTDDDCDDGDDVCTLDLCNNGVCQFPPTGAEGCCFSNLIDEGFEDGVADGWVFDASTANILAFEVGEFDAYSGNWSLKAQGNNVSAPNSVQAILPVGVIPPVGAKLSFRLKLSMASSGDCSDNVFEVKFNDQVLVQYCNSIVEWLKVEVPMDGLGGETGVLSMDFRVSPNGLSNFTVLVDSVLLTQDCCSTDDDCNDNNDCTTDHCPGSNSVCQFEYIPGCCLSNSECEDQNPCTIDECINNECSYIDQCCESDAECNDQDDVCTTDLCIDGWCYFQPTGAAGCCEPEQYFESFESNSLEGWTVDNESAQYGWRISDFQAQTGNFSLYYGDQYATTYGTSNEGTITSPPILVPAAPSAMIRLWAWYDTESNWDELVLRAVLEDGTVVGVAEVSGNSMGWVELQYDISDVAGQTIQLQAYFDSDFSGSGQGVFLDDIRIEIGCCSVDADCEDGNPCTTDFCPGTEANCANVPVVGCCLNHEDCWDGNNCTIDRCQDDNTCTNTDVCCESDTDCDDGDDICTNDLCIDSFCFFQPTGEPGCCIPEAAAYDFEDGTLTDWTVTNPTNGSAWRISSDAFEGNFSLYFGKADESEYNASSDAAIVTKDWIELPVSDVLTLDFETKYDMESCCDDYKVYVVTQTEEVFLQEINGTQATWTHKSYDISAYSGQNVKVKFTFHCDGSVQKDGPHIDNIQILKSCCFEDADCDDMNPCTTDSCPGEQSDCINQPISGCCFEEGDCDDADPCTTDACGEDNVCVHENICCTSDAECDDGDDLCTEDLCIDSHCQYNWIPGETCCQPDFYRMDFEDQSLSGFEIVNAGEGTWHITTTDSVSGNASLIYAKSSDAEYGNNNNSVLITPPVLIPANVIGPKLSFWLRYETESNYDYLRLFILVDGVESQLQNYTGSGNNVWTLAEFDMTPYVGQTVQVKFLFYSDGSAGYYDGAFIDDLAFTQDCCGSVEDCDDGNPCTTETCTGVSGYCQYEPVADCCVSDDECADADECTEDVCNADNVCTHTNQCCTVDEDCDDGNAECTYDQCGDDGFCQYIYTGAPGCCTEPYLFDSFATDQGWTYGEQWQRAQATASTCSYSSYNNDPSVDHSGSADDFIAGVMVGGCIDDDSVDSTYWLTSPVVDTSDAGILKLGFWRFLNSDKSPYLNNLVEVFDGNQWVQVWQSGTTNITDSVWTYVEYDASDYANAEFQVRFGTLVLASYSWSSPSWNIDDVVIFSDPEALCCTYDTQCVGFGLECANGACLSECLPYCIGKECGTDGCGGSCGNCQTGEVCTDAGLCCVPNCDEKDCGDDGCGGSCGTCGANEACEAFACVCAEGNAPCGDLCCDTSDVCFEEQCCTPNCDGKECGDDGCGGTCGTCVEGQLCDDAFACVCDYEYFGFSDEVQKTSYFAFGLSGMDGEGIDVDGDATTCAPEEDCEAGIDNQLGGVLAQVAGLLNPNGLLADNLASGAIVVVMESVDLKTDGSDFTMNIYTGFPAAPLAECDILTQSCMYYLDTEAFSPDTCRGYVSMTNARIIGEEFRAGGPGYEISVPMPLGDGTSILVTASNARIEGEAVLGQDGFTLMDARLGGAVNKQLLLETVLALPDDVQLPISKATIVTLLEELLVPDIDADGDGVAESVSVGMKFATIDGTIVGVQ